MAVLTGVESCSDERSDKAHLKRELCKTGVWRRVGKDVTVKPENSPKCLEEMHHRTISGQEQAEGRTQKKCVQEVSLGSLPQLASSGPNACA